MIKTKVLIFSLSAVAVSGVADVREKDARRHETLLIPYSSVGDSVPMQRYPYTPVVECVDVNADSAINLITECASSRIGWLKL